MARLVGTIVAIATGMFTLRDAVRPEEAGDAGPPIDVYELLDSARRAVARSTHDLARFEAVDVPPKRARRHEETVGIWHRNVEAIRDYAHRLESRDPW